jgi:hypothetical protein
VREPKLASEPEALLALLTNRAYRFKQQAGRNDARGISQMMRVGLYRSVCGKMLRSQKPSGAAGAFDGMVLAQGPGQ